MGWIRPALGGPPTVPTSHWSSWIGAMCVSFGVLLGSCLKGRPTTIYSMSWVVGSFVLWGGKVMATHRGFVYTVPWEGPGVVARPSTNFYVNMRMGVGVARLVARHPPFFIYFFCFLKTNCTILGIQFWTKGVFLTRPRFFPETS